jgi:excisionase family DNA binding protein
MTQELSLTPSTRPTIDVAHAAQYLGVSERTIRRLVASHAISFRRVVGLIRFTESDLNDYTERVRVTVDLSVVN